MPARILQLIIGVLALTALAVGPSAAIAHTAPTANSAGDGGGYCDHYSPYSHWGHNWWDRDGDGRYWRGWGDGDGYFDGSSYDRGCNGGGYGNSARTAAGRVARVMVAAKRMRGDGLCQHLHRSGYLSRPGSCTHTNWMRADGTSSWRFAIRRALPRGHYRLLRRAVDAAGNREHKRLLHLRIR
jgi:hypothetical protein